MTAELGASHSASFSFLHTRAVSVNALLGTGSKEEEIRATLVTPYYSPENYKLCVIVGESSATLTLGLLPACRDSPKIGLSAIDGASRERYTKNVLQKCGVSRHPAHQLQRGSSFRKRRSS